MPSRVLRSLRPPLIDAAVAAAFVAATLAEALTSDTDRSPIVHALLTVPSMAGLAWRRRFPLTVFAFLLATNLVVNPTGEFSTLLALVLASFTIGSELDAPRSWIALGVACAAFLGGLAMEGLEPSDVAAAIVFLGGPCAVGVALRRRSERAAEAIERAAEVERRRDADTAAAAADERARIARELHDIVSHSISVIAIQTQAVRRRLGPEREREASDLAAVETTARQALAEMRRLFGVLRADGDAVSLAPQPGVAELARLAEEVRRAGLPVGFQIEGEAVALPPGVDLALYRIAQEGLTNALRHARAEHANVTVTYGDNHVAVVVEDDGRGGNGAPDGHGLLGIRERVSLYGGSVAVGSNPSGGFRLAASLPIRERS